MRAGDFDHAAGASSYLELKVVQLNNSGDEAETKSNAFGLSAGVRAIKTSGHSRTFVCANAWPGVADAHDTRTISLKQGQL